MSPLIQERAGNQRDVTTDSMNVYLDVRYDGRSGYSQSCSANHVAINNIIILLLYM